MNVCVRVLCYVILWGNKVQIGEYIKLLFFWVGKMYISTNPILRGLESPVTKIQQQQTKMSKILI